MVGTSIAGTSEDVAALVLTTSATTSEYTFLGLDENGNPVINLTAVKKPTIKIMGEFLFKGAGVKPFSHSNAAQLALRGEVVLPQNVAAKLVIMPEADMSFCEQAAQQQAIYQRNSDMVQAKLSNYTPELLEAVRTIVTRDSIETVEGLKTLVHLINRNNF
jgi:hypothetical protein